MVKTYLIWLFESSHVFRYQIHQPKYGKHWNVPILWGFEMKMALIDLLREGWVIIEKDEWSLSVWWIHNKFFFLQNSDLADSIWYQTIDSVLGNQIFLDPKWKRTVRKVIFVSAVIVLLSHFLIVLLCYCLIVLLSYCLIVLLFYCVIVLLCYIFGFEIQQRRSSQHKVTFMPPTLWFFSGQNVY